jgi:geranylgeranyl diphosphate synthase type II
MNLDSYLKDRLDLVDRGLDTFLPDADRLPGALHKAMRYSVFAGGKRIRPILMCAACEAVGGMAEMALPAACAIEMLHTYSLIHDDLPAMDDDDFRRGRPTNHKVFGEATAILAGDALLTEAFLLLSAPEVLPAVTAEVRRDLIHILAHAAGSLGMVGGQVVDMESEGKTINLPTLEYIHTHKTGALILAAVQMGALIGGADATTMTALTRFGEAAGLAFQIADDILDIIGEQDVVGKDIGSDQARGKATYPALLGLEEAKRRACELRDLGITALSELGTAAEPLRQIVHYIVDRSS